MKKKDLLKVLVNSILIFINILLLFLPNETDSLKFIGYYLYFLSLAIFIRYRNNQNVSLLLGIILMTTLSLTNSICFNLEETAFYWQKSLIGIPSNIINMKNYSLCVTFFCLFLGKIKDKKINLNYRNNDFYFFIFLSILLFILLFGFDKGIVGTYVVNRNPLYEYGNVVFLFAWIYTNNNKTKKGVLIIYAIIFCLQALLFGSRTSAFPMILLFIMLYSKKIKLPYVLLIGLAGILFGNFIDVFRNVGFDFVRIFSKMQSTGLFINTLTYSHYAGTQIIEYSLLESNRLLYILNYILTTFLGNSDKVNLSYIARTAGFVNQGGGFSHTYFYYIGGYIGTVIISTALSRIINKIFNSERDISNVLKVTIIIYTLRWFIYYPFTLTRTAIFVPCFIYFVTNKLNVLVRKKQCNYEGIRTRNNTKHTT